MDKTYLDLIKEAESHKHLILRDCKDELKQVYADAYKGLYSKTQKGPLTRAWANTYRKELKQRTKELNKQELKVISKFIRKTFFLASEPNKRFFQKIHEETGLKVAKGLQACTSQVPEKAIMELIQGKIYSDKRSLSQRIWRNSQETFNRIDHILQVGIAQKKSTLEIAKDLEEFVNPEARLPWAWKKVYPNAGRKTIDYNAQRLARTAVQHAFQLQTKRTSQRNPFVDKIEWRSVLQHGRTCDLCKSRHGVKFTPDELPLDHPNGLCTMIPVVSKSMQEIGTQLRQWVDGKDDKMLDDWYKEWGHEFI